MKIYHGTIAESERTLGGFNWPSIARLSDGRLAVVSSGFRLAHVCPFGKVTIQYSSDEGITWTPPAVILDSPLDDRDAGIAVYDNRVIVTSFNNSRAFQTRLAERDRTEREKALIEAYLATIGEKEEEKYLGATFVVSRNGGISFGKIGRVPVSSPHGPAVLPDGSLFYLGKAFCIVGAMPSQYTVYDSLGILDSPGMLLTCANGFGFNFIVLYGFFKSLPWDFVEASFLDGAGHLQTMLYIMLPQAMPVIGSLGIVAFINMWNDYNIRRILTVIPFVFVLRKVSLFPQRRALSHIIFGQVRRI